MAGHTFAHEVQTAVDAGMFGSLDINQGDPHNGWDTDEFMHNLYDAVEIMLVILQSDGLTTGGMNFDVKTRRSSTDLDDIFIAHIAGMDTFARAFEITLDLLKKSDYQKMKSDRYASFDSGSGAKFENGELSLEQLSELAKVNGEPKQISGKQEFYESIINQYIK